MEQNAQRAVFATAVVAMLVLVGSLSYLYIGGGQLPGSGNGSQGGGSVPTTANPAPDFNYYAVNGGVVSVSGNRGKVIIIDFMATWCQPCKDQILALKPIQSEYAAGGVVVISLNLDLQLSDRELLEYRNQLGATWGFATDSDSVSANPKYAVTSIPTIVIIDRDGNIARKNVGFMSEAAIRAAIDPLL